MWPSRRKDCHSVAQPCRCKKALCDRDVFAWIDSQRLEHISAWAELKVYTGMELIPCRRIYGTEGCPGGMQDHAESVGG